MFLSTPTPGLTASQSTGKKDVSARIGLLRVGKMRKYIPSDSIVILPQMLPCSLDVV